MTRARDFYVNVLGFGLRDDSGNFVELSLGDSVIALNAALDDDTKHPGYQTILLESDNIDKDYETLTNQVKVLASLADPGYGKTFIIADPDGNKVEVVEAA